MLKHLAAVALLAAVDQPPSGGCVLKHAANRKRLFKRDSAAFGRLCVETSLSIALKCCSPPAAFGRLCVETINQFLPKLLSLQPPSGGCVLKQG